MKAIVLLTGPLGLVLALMAPGIGEQEKGHREFERSALIASKYVRKIRMA
jgi:SpoVK/Ycf46/Vps4 family AAA+-type ATPase